jgi:hypothetical protein
VITDCGLAKGEPVEISVLLNVTEWLAVTGKKTTLDVPPPGLGLVTVIQAVLAVAMSLAGIVAVTLALLTNVVAFATPFHFTTEDDTNPAPFTVKTN